MINGMIQGRFVVVRTHSHTDKQCLWKVMSRPIKNYNDALILKECCESLEKNKDHKFSILEVKE